MVEHVHGANDGLRRLHLGMIDAVVAGRGPRRVAALAAQELRGQVAIVLPATGVAVIEPREADTPLSIVARYVRDQLLGRATEVPAGLVAESLVRSGEQRLGVVALLDARPHPHASEILQLAALATITALALENAADLAPRAAQIALLEDLHATPPLPGRDVVARARRLGCDLSQGATALCVRPAPGQTERILATIAQEFPHAIAAVHRGRVEALLSTAPDGRPGDLHAVARRLALRLQPQAPIGLAPFEHDVDQLPRSLHIAQLMQALDERESIKIDAMATGSWRVLLHVGATEPGQLDALIDSSVGPALTYDEAGRVPLLETLRAYLDHGGNMAATGRTIHAHRHTVAYRLDRVAELTGYDPHTPRGQAQLELGLQALTIRDAIAAETEDRFARGSHRSFAPAGADAAWPAATPA